MSLTFDQMLQNYADLAVKVGTNIQPGQRLILRAPINTAPLARLIAASAYKAGARLVDVMWTDDALTLARFQHAPRDSFDEYPTWRTDALEESAKAGDAMLSILATDPDLLQNQEPELIATVQHTSNRYMAGFRSHIMRDAVNWCVIAAPIAAWAAKVFPNEASAQQENKLWQAIFKACRVDQADPISAWQSHIKNLFARSDYLNNKQYATLRMKAPDTDLTIGLPKGHIWKSGQSTSEGGIKFTANIPTEEVFTLPHKDKTNGILSSTKPLNYGGTLINKFSLTFENGRVTNVTAEQGEAMLQSLVDTDEGASRLGEVALVPYSSPISQSGMLYYNTLFDENAANHVALGRAYKFNLQGGTTMSDDEFASMGGNYSLTHVDFMIGSEQMDIDGVTETGDAEPVMRGGEWAFET